MIQSTFIIDASAMKNKEQTKRKLVEAVGHVFKTDSYNGLGVNRVARIAGVNKKLIYRYFGSFENLVEAYVTETDYWIAFARHMAAFDAGLGNGDIGDFIGKILIRQFDYFKGHPEMQQLILWELSTDSALMRSIHRTRELMGQQFFAIADPHLKDNAVNFRAVAALLVGGIYYTILHTRHNGGMFSDIDLSTAGGQSDLKNAIGHIIRSSFPQVDS
jgi:AcrR family transcriptional regulator